MQLNLKHLDHLGSTRYKTIERGGSLSSQVRASPSRENGKSKSLIVVFGTSGCLNVEVTLLKNRREEINIVTDTDGLLPPGFEDDDSDGEIDAVDELRVDNPISNSENELSDNEASDFDNPGGFCLSCDLKAENSFTYDPNAYSFNDTSNNFNHLPQPQFENYLCNLCGNNSHDGYDCQQQFPLVYKQCQPMDQNIDSSGLDQIQTPRYPNSITYLLEKKPKILLQAWDKFFAIQHAQPEDSNELFQKILEDLQIINKELTENNHPTFFDDNKDHSVQYKEYLDNSSKEIAALNSNQEKEKKPQDSDIRQLIREECCIEVCETKKQNMKDTMLELIEVCRQNKFYCMHDNVDDLIEGALNSKLLLINFESQRFDKKKQEVKNVVEQPIERGTQPEYSLSMGYEHFNTTPETKSDEVIKSSAKNLLPFPSVYEVTSDDGSECDVPDKEDSFPAFTTFLNPLFNDNDDFTSSDDESLPDEDVLIEEFKVYSNPFFDDKEIKSNEIDPHHFNVESDFVEYLSNRDTLIDSSPKFDFLDEFSGVLMPTSIADEERIRREHAEYISLMERIYPSMIEVS
nr:hypothetical protein [Tanacetum cinerariifolium]